jgi:hypothetical protein
VDFLLLLLVQEVFGELVEVEVDSIIRLMEVMVVLVAVVELMVGAHKAVV